MIDHSYKAMFYRDADNNLVHVEADRMDIMGNGVLLFFRRDRNDNTPLLWLTVADGGWRSAGYREIPDA